MKKLCIIVVLFLLAGCRDDLPEPETIQETPAIETASSVAKKKTDMTVRHVVQGNQVYVECIVPDITFTNNNSAKKGKIVVSLDGKRFSEYNTAAFIMKGIPKGVHHLKVEIVKLNNEPLGMSKQFYVTIS
ncbi:hypothetical protein JOC86_003259 [Bacillus pakistanensis]|uniref:Lipoprotein n=1 Tax=Rossellomorea pakistanensis TaxID=992288 RepID=A0ABS2NFU6_9BACI|nr:hypothetical protein [Bacillus pakistanensis]MBM7586707.1 hypothetical protein [Bacillus pakistanensis]